LDKLNSQTATIELRYGNWPHVAVWVFIKTLTQI